MSRSSVRRCRATPAPPSSSSSPPTTALSAPRRVPSRSWSTRLCDRADVARFIERPRRRAFKTATGRKRCDAFTQARDVLYWLQSCSASRSAPRASRQPGVRKQEARTRTGARPTSSGRNALPTRGSARRTIRYVARPPGALGHPLLCGMASLTPRRKNGAARLSRAVLAGVGDHARKDAGIAVWAPMRPMCGWKARPPRASAATREAHATGPTGCACFLGQSVAISRIRPTHRRCDAWPNRSG